MGHCASLRRPADSYTTAVSCGPCCRDLPSITGCRAALYNQTATSGDTGSQWALFCTLKVEQALTLTAVLTTNSLMKSKLICAITTYYSKPIVQVDVPLLMLFKIVECWVSIQGLLYEYFTLSNTLSFYRFYQPTFKVQKHVINKNIQHTT